MAKLTPQVTAGHAQRVTKASPAPAGVTRPRRPVPRRSPPRRPGPTRRGVGCMALTPTAGNGARDSSPPRGVRPGRHPHQWKTAHPSGSASDLEPLREIPEPRPRREQQHHSTRRRHLRWALGGRCASGVVTWEHGRSQRRERTPPCGHGGNDTPRSGSGRNPPGHGAERSTTPNNKH